MPAEDSINRVLIVDDERNIRRMLRMILEGQGYSVDEAANAEDGLAKIEGGTYHAVLMDVRLPGIDGISALKKINAFSSPPPVVMISGHASIKDAVDAVRMGAFDFLEKPLDRERIVNAVKHCIEVVIHTRKSYEKMETEMVGKSRGMQKIMDEITKVAPSGGRVFITGESGTGKELVARCIHALSNRASGPFVKLNCAAIPSELIESELFGYEKGAFTGAQQRKKGMIELAHDGTLFLDEVGDMGPATQAKVLRVLQTGEYARLGSEEVNIADVRVVSATNKDIVTEIANGRFREDLFYRLNVVPVHVPPLRERTEDIPELTLRFLVEACAQMGVRTKSIVPEAIEVLQGYSWPGNIRELKNLVERLVIMTGPQKMQVEKYDLPDYILHPSQPDADKKTKVIQSETGKSLKEAKGEVEKEMIIKSLEENDWNVSKTATALGIERTNLHKKMKQHNIQRIYEKT